MFLDHFHVIDTRNIFMPSDHTFQQFFTQFTPGTVFFLFIIFIVSGKLLRCCCRHYEVDSCYSILEKVEKIKIEPKLPNFYSAMKSDTREAMIREEVLCNKRLNSSKLSKEALMELVC